MNLDLLENDKDSIGYSDIIKSASTKVEKISLYSEDYGSSSKVRSLLKEWYIKGYFQALDDYKKIAR